MQHKKAKIKLYKIPNTLLIKAVCAEVVGTSPFKTVDVLADLGVLTVLRKLILISKISLRWFEQSQLKLIVL